MKVTVVSIVIGILGTILKRLAKRLEELKIQESIKNQPDSKIFKNS